jgi:hypothetical protein
MAATSDTAGGEHRRGPHHGHPPTYRAASGPERGRVGDGRRHSHARLAHPLRQDGTFEVSELGGRLQSEVVDEPGPQPPVGLESLHLATAPGQREHEELGTALPQRLVRNQGLERRNQLAVTPQMECRVGPLLEGQLAQRCQPAELARHSGVVGRDGLWAAAPQCERFVEDGQPLLRQRRQLSRFDRGLEAPCVGGR